MTININPVSLDSQHAAILSEVAQQTGKSYQQLVADAIEIAFANREQLNGIPPSPEQQRQNLHSLLEKMSQLPVCHPQDGLSGRDHDQILYGRNAT